jgi:hypothetical protein
MSEVTTSKTETNLGKNGPAFAVAGVVGIGVLIFSAVTESSRQATLQSYLFAVILFMSITLGCFALSILQHVVQAKWGLPVLRIFEAGGGARNFLLLLVLMIPIGLGAHYLYPWAQPDLVKHDHVLQHRANYLNWGFIVLRFLVYFGIWAGYAYYMRNSVKRQEATGRFKEQQKRANLGAPGLVLVVLTVTFAYTDWVMAIDAHWWSTMYGLWFVAGMGLGGISIAAIISCLNADKAPYNQIVNKNWTRDIGNLMFTFVMLWGYTNLGQYLIIWHGNLPETTTYLINRSLGGWSILSAVLVVGQFFIPFFALLSPTVKAKPKYLATVAAWILLMRLVDHFHVIEPFFRRNMGVNFLDVFAIIGVGGLWAWMFSLNIKRAPLLPTYDPRLLEVPEHAH